MEEYFIPAIDGQKKRNLKYNEIQYLIKNITDAENKSPDEKKLKEAIKYCNWLSEREGIAKAYDNNGKLIDKNSRQTTDIAKVEGHLLPTEAEWEYAARGGHKSTGDYKYAGSNIFTP